MYLILFHRMEKKQSPSLETESRVCRRVESCPLPPEEQKQS